jgi:hypothetical protein
VQIFLYSAITFFYCTTNYFFYFPAAAPTTSTSPAGVSDVGTTEDLNRSSQRVLRKRPEMAAPNNKNKTDCARQGRQRKRLRIIRKHFNMQYVSCKHGIVRNECLLCTTLTAARKRTDTEAKKRLDMAKKCQQQKIRKPAIRVDSETNTVKKCQLKTAFDVAQKIRQNRRNKLTQKNNASGNKGGKRCPVASTTASARTCLGKSGRVNNSQSPAQRRKVAQAKPGKNQSTGKRGIKRKCTGGKPSSQQKRKRIKLSEQPATKQFKNSRGRSVLADLGVRSGNSLKQATSQRGGVFHKQQKNTFTKKSLQKKLRMNRNFKAKVNATLAKVIAHHEEAAKSCERSEDLTFTSTKDMFAQLCQLENRSNDYDFHSLSSVLPGMHKSGTSSLFGKLPQAVASAAHIGHMSVYSSSVAKHSHHHVGGVWNSIFGKK